MPTRTVLAILALTPLVIYKAVGCVGQPVRCNFDMATESSGLGAHVLEGNEIKTANLPYTAFVFNLDMAMLAYQTYAQTLFWPADPFYEKIQRHFEIKSAPVFVFFHFFSR